MKLLQYKGYYGSIEASLEDDCLFGKLEFIDPLVNYEGETVKELEQAFQKAVDDYLATCEQLGQAPATTCRGSFNVRIGPDLHQAALVVAREDEMSLNDVVKRALNAYVESRHAQ